VISDNQFFLPPYVDKKIKICQPHEFFKKKFIQRVKFLKKMRYKYEIFLNFSKYLNQPKIHFYCILYLSSFRS